MDYISNNFTKPLGEAEKKNVLFEKKSKACETHPTFNNNI